MTASTGYDDKRPSGYKINRIQNFSPEQMQLFKDSFQYINPQSNLARLAGGDPQAFQQMEAPALRQFNELQGNLASRFSGMGSFGGRRSSGFQNAATSAASNFAQELQANRQALQRQALMDLMGYSNSLLSQKPYETFLTPKQRGGFNWGGAAGGLLGGIGGFLTGGPLGAFQGAGLGYNVGSGLSGNPSSNGYSGGFDFFNNIGGGNSNARLLAQAMQMRG